MRDNPLSPLPENEEAFLLFKVAEATSELLLFASEPKLGQVNEQQAELQDILDEYAHWTWGDGS